LAVLALFQAGRPLAVSEVITVFSTGFEIEEGYDPAFTLAGQQGWIAFGTGGNGLASETNGFPGLGQQAYVGLFPPLDFESSLVVWRPINLDPVPASTPLVKFSTIMEIVDSTDDLYDCFRWSVFNANGDRLFQLDFDNTFLTINYRLQDSPFFVATGATFSNDLPYRLLVVMDFAQNLWSARLDGTLLVTNLPITDGNLPLNLGDIDAVWVYGDPENPGDNAMVFDNYQITREPASVLPPTLAVLGRPVGGLFPLCLTGEPGRRYAIEATADFKTWIPLRTNTADGGSFDFLDTTASGVTRRFYRGRLVP
jgi:hypothetical protein